MADSTKKTNGEKKRSSLDPIYEKYCKSIVRALGSTEFYRCFMDAVSHAENTVRFYNKKVVKSVDIKWVNKIDEALNGMQNIISNPRQVIREEEIIVNVANAKKTGDDVVRHLAQHGALVETFDEQTGEVRPQKLMQKLRGDSFTIYENRLVYTVLERAFQFVKIRADALLGTMGDEVGAKLEYTSDMLNDIEKVHTDTVIHIQQRDDVLEADRKNADVFARINRIQRVLSAFMGTEFAQGLSKNQRVKGTIVKTNALKRNPNYKAIVKLYEFLNQYDEVGYSIRIVEQAPRMSDELMRNIFHSVMMNYIMVKNCMEDEEDREVAGVAPEKKKTIKPKFIKKIIEEITDDYDLPEVEIRKVLIEELTKSDLMKQEAEERRRLVEEREQRKKAEQQRIRDEKAAEKKRIKEEKEAEAARINKKKEADAALAHALRLERENEDERRSQLFIKECLYFEDVLSGRLELREKENERLEKLKEKAEKARERDSDKMDSSVRAGKTKKVNAKQLEGELLLQLEEQGKKREEEEKQKAAALAYIQPYLDFINGFMTVTLPENIKNREEYLLNLRAENAEYERRKQLRREQQKVRSDE